MKRALGWLTVALLGFAPALGSDGQGWFNNSLTVGLQKGWRFKLTHELRTREVEYRDTFLRNASAGFFRDLPKGTYAGAAYKREEVETARLAVHEDRLQLEGGWKRSLAEPWRLDLRFRAEIREFEEPAVEDHLRFRLRVRLRRPVAVKGVKLTPFLWDEIFHGTTSDVVGDRNRFSLGTSVRLHRHVELMVSYLRQDTRHREPLHVLNTGFDLKF